MQGKAPLDPRKYPLYFMSGKLLLAFVAPDKMYKIEPIGTNKNEGVAIDHYKTRKMVLKHWGSATSQVSVSEFEITVLRLFSAYIAKIINH